MSIKDEILRSVVIHYIGDETPIGSVQLQKEYALDISSATIRNHFKKLVLEGMLEQLHSSSGRIPTNEALIAFWTNEIKGDRPLRIGSAETLKRSAERFNIYVSLHSDREDRLVKAEAYDEKYVILSFESGAVMIPYNRAVERFLREFSGLEMRELILLSKQMGINELTRVLLRFKHEHGFARFNKAALIGIADKDPEWSEKYFDYYYDGEAAFWLHNGVTIDHTVPAGCLVGRQHCQLDGEEYIMTYMGEVSRDYRSFLSSL